MKTKEKEESPKSCKTVRSSLIFILASAAAAALVYVTIKEGQRIKKENELLEYEVW